MKIASIVVAGAILIVLTGCSGVNASRTAERPTGVPAPIHTRDGAHAGGEGAGGAGSLTVALTEPVALAGHVDTPVTCTTGHTYRAVAGPATIDGTSIALTVVVASYSVPGSYSAVVTASVTPAGAAQASVGGLPGIPVTITSSGGSIALTATGASGKSIAGSFSWACS